MRGVSRVAEAQRVEHRDRPRAEREDVAQDAADAGGRALEGLDRRGVVVALDLEHDREAVAGVDRAGVLARAHQHPLALGRAACAAASSSACRRSARTTAARRPPARPGSARARAASTMRPSSDAVRPRACASASRRRRCRGGQRAASDGGERAEQAQAVGGARSARRPRARGAASGRARCRARS